MNKVKPSFSFCGTLAVSHTIAGHGRFTLPTAALSYCQAQPLVVNAPAKLKVRCVHDEGAKQITVQGRVKKFPGRCPSIGTRWALLEMQN